MSLTSWSFLLFAAVAVAVYYILPKKRRWWALLAAGVVFYAQGGVSVMGYLAVTAVSTYLAGAALGKLNSDRRAMPEEKRRESRGIFDRRRHLIVAAVCVVNFGMLFVIKYWDFTAEAISAGTGIALPTFGLLLPMGISFYIFQSVGYVVDVSRGSVSAERNFFKYFLFVSFFPQMVQGPIDRFGRLQPQLMEGHDLDTDNLRDGIQLMMWGYFKKLVIAGRASVAVAPVYANGGAYPGSVVAFAVLMYTVELYADFSGGIDIVRGTARLFGIDMAENFRRPLFSVSLAEFWRRWHMTLGAWMKDYVFYPLSLSKPFAALGRFSRKRLGGTVGRILPTSLATFIVYFIIGIWHGANYTYLAYGLYNGGIITASILLAPTYGRLKGALRINDKSPLYRGFCMVRTAVIVFFGRYLTRAPWLKMSFIMLRQTFLDFRISALPSGLAGLGVGAADIAVVALGCCAVVGAEALEERGVRIRQSLAKRGFFVQWMGILVPLAVILFFGILTGNGGTADFIYGRI